MKKVFLMALAIIVVSGLIFSGCAAPAPPPEEVAPPPEEVAPPAPPEEEVAPAPPEEEVAPAPPEEEVAPAPAPVKYGGIMKLVFDKPASAFGYPPTIRAADTEYACQALQVLVKIGPTVEPEPVLATSWELAPDGKSYIFHLRKGVKFHDGTDFNAQAAKYNIDLFLESARAVLENITSVDVLDDYTIRLNASEFSALTLYELSQDIRIASPAAIEKNGKEWAETHPVGTGPFKFASYERNVSLKYVRFDDYWEKGLPYLDGVECLMVKDPMTRLACLKAGEAQGIYNVPHEHVKMLLGEGYNLVRHTAITVGIFGDSVNPDSPFANKKVRMAIEYAIDKDAINEMGLGYYPPMYQLTTEDSPFYNPEIKPRKYDPEKAKQLLTEAGYPDGFSTKLTYLSVHWPEMWQLVQSYLAKVGIDMEMEPVDRPAYLQIRFGGGGVLKNSCSHIVMPMAYDTLYQIKSFLTEASGHCADMAKPPQIDPMVEEALKIKDPEVRKEKVKEMAKIFYDDASRIPLYGEPRLVIMDKSINDYDYFTYGPTVSPFTNAWISK